MSGIFGVFHPDGRPVSRADLNRMDSALAHRGPDGAGIWDEGPVGLGHRMLWTTPESLHEQQPRVNQMGDLVVTADARIDNREDLIGILRLTGGSHQTISDSEIIFAAYQEWGESCPDRLLGDFAFAIWDQRRETLFCARDHFGVKPLFYHSSNRIFAFASELKALRCLDEVPCRLNEVKVADFLVGHEDPTNTFYQEILRLPPGHSISVRQERATLRRYWALEIAGELRLGSDEEYAEALRERFIEAVRYRMRSASPLGSMLSGGVDSSSITCVARDLLIQNGAQRLNTFSAVFDQVVQCDERPFQNAVLAQGGCEPHLFHADQVGPLADLDRLLQHQDEAISTGNLRTDLGIYDLAQQQGVRVMLDGFDGDSTISHGDGYLVELARAHRWLPLASEVQAYAVKLEEPWIPAIWSWVWVYGVDPLLSRDPVLRRARKVWRRVARRALRQQSRPIREAAWKSLIRADFLGRIGMEQRLNVQFDTPMTEREIHHRRLTHPGMVHTLEVLDKASAPFSVEVRFPFWDKRLVEFCLALPADQKLRHGWNRWVMRRAMDGVLPRDIQWRGRKTNLHPSFEHGLLNFERCRFEEALIDHGEMIEEYVDISAVREAYRCFLAGEATAELVNTVWRVASLGLWLHRTSLVPST